MFCYVKKQYRIIFYFKNIYLKSRTNVFDINDKNSQFKNEYNEYNKYIYLTHRIYRKKEFIV